jgi:hypothetical protein
MFYLLSFISVLIVVKLKQSFWGKMVNLSVKITIWVQDSKRVTPVYVYSYENNLYSCCSGLVRLKSHLMLVLTLKLEVRITI